MDQGGAQRRRRVHGTPTPNGRRSSFRDWAAEATDHRREVVEAALAHVVRNKVEAAEVGRFVSDWVIELTGIPDRIPAD